jgi:hypothetical protein
MSSRQPAQSIWSQQRKAALLRWPKADRLSAPLTEDMRGKREELRANRTHYYVTTIPTTQLGFLAP